MTYQNEQVKGYVALALGQVTIFPRAYVLYAMGKGSVVLTYFWAHALSMTANSLLPSSENSYKNCMQFLQLISLALRVTSC